MIVSPSKKNKISLTDYNYRRDIENRLLLSQFTVLEVEVLEEILNSSLTISSANLADEVEITVDKLVPILNKLSKTRLLTLQGDVITVDKEMRKYYDFLIQLFDDDFRPDMEFLQGLLRKVPIQVLPTWYSIPKTSDNIFSSLVEKSLLTPRIFERYVAELAIEDPIMLGIMEDVYASPDLKLRSRELREKYHLTRELFEEYMLHLEFNVLCCLSYNRIGDEWKEVVTPFAEWREYLQFKRESAPKGVEHPEEVVRHCPEDFGPLKDLETLIRDGREALKNSSQVVLQGQAQEEYFSALGDLADSLRLGDEWLAMSPEDRAIYLYRHPMGKLYPNPELATDRNIREIERSLRAYNKVGWTLFEDYLKGLSIAVGSAQEVALRKQGKRWRYAIPEYNADELELIRFTVLQRLCNLGMVATGHYRGKPCFKLTQFGTRAISD